MRITKRRFQWVIVAGPVAFALGGLSSVSHAQSAASTDQGKENTLEEVIVSAQKRMERVQDVPVPVTAISAERLVERNQVRLQDYFAEVPSLNLNSGGNGQATIIIRGINTGAVANPAFGVTIDDVPFGSSSAYGYGDRLIPDLDPTDLQRVEVLRGPQGTLYGASNMGGLLKFVSNDPSLSELQGRAQADLNSVTKGDSGYGVRGGVSFPLISDRLAVSFSAFKRKDAGFIDDPVRGIKDVNDVDYKGGRAALLWQLSDALTLKLAALAQDTEGHGTNITDTDSGLHPTLGELQHAGAPGTGGYDLKVRLYTANLIAQLGNYQLTSLSGWGTNDYVSPLEFRSPFWSGLAQSFFNVSGTNIVNAFRTEKFSQELRLASPTGTKLEWMLGAFYTNEKTPVTQTLNAANPTTGETAGALFASSFPTKYEEHAAFGNLTVHFTDRFDTQFGARYSKNRQRYDEVDSGAAASLLFGAPQFVFDTQRTEDTASTYLVTPRFKVSPDLMLYARVASGYRAGGNNGEATAFNLPLTFKPDKTMNYELGMKGTLFDRVLTFDTSIYYIDWKDVQIAQTDPLSGLVFFTNGGKARSQGVELSLSSNPMAGLSVVATTSYTDAQLRSDLPLSAGLGFAGDRMPLSARFAASLSIDQDFSITSSLHGFVGASGSHIGERLGSFVNPVSTSPLVPGVRNRLPAYTTADLRAGLRFDTWTTSVFVDNVTDERGLLNAQSQIQGRARPTDPYKITVIRPRTYGVSVAKTF